MPHHNMVRSKMSADFIFGIHSVNALIQESAHDVVHVFVKRGSPKLAALASKAQQEGIALTWVEGKKLDALSEGANHQGVVAQLTARFVEKRYDLNAILEQSTNPLIMVLDGVTDPHNLGACLRSANAFGVDAVIVPKDRAVGLTPTVRKVASGAAETVPLIQVTNLARTLSALKEKGLWLVGLDERADTTLSALDLTHPTVIVLGAEGEGLRQLTAKTCDYLASIPMQGTVPSLNVSVATGISLFEVKRQRA